jgi:hypothetical protein
MKKDLQTSPQGRLHNGDREYLQLCGAWVDHFLDLPDMAKEILDTVALLRCLDPPHGGGRYECLGYPSSLSLDGGFYLPPLRSIREHITRQDWDTHKGYEQKLMVDDMLYAYYGKVEAKERAMTADRDKASSTVDGAGSGN